MNKKIILSLLMLAPLSSSAGRMREALDRLHAQKEAEARKEAAAPKEENLLPELLQEKKEEPAQLSQLEQEAIEAVKKIEGTRENEDELNKKLQTILEIFEKNKNILNEVFNKESNLGKALIDYMNSNKQANEKEPDLINQSKNNTSSDQRDEEKKEEPAQLSQLEQEAKNQGKTEDQPLQEFEGTEDNRVGEQQINTTNLQNDSNAGGEGVDQDSTQLGQVVKTEVLENKDSSDNNKQSERDNAGDSIDKNTEEEKQDKRSSHDEENKDNPISVETKDQSKPKTSYSGNKRTQDMINKSQSKRKPD